MHATSRLRRLLVGATTLALTAGAAIVVSVAPLGSGVAGAVTPSGPGPVLEPTAGMPTTDALPTVQIDGVAWAQVIVGNTVYVGGSFANARPAGAAAGTNLTPRADMLAYTLSTGVLNTGFAPTFNGQVRALAVSPDHGILYVGGDFTTVNGLVRNRIAAFNLATGALLNSFAPAGFDASVKALAVNGSTVYAGGLFSSANGVSRNHVAAFNATDGSLTSWNPNADGVVNALVLTPDGSEVIAGGAFEYMNGIVAYGLAALDASRATLQPWAAANSIFDAGQSAAITSLTTDGTNVIGTGYVYGPGGNLEGMFSATADAGVLNWMEDCHGDTYSAYVTPAVAYEVSHSHQCSTVGSFPQIGNGSSTWTFHRAQAFTNYANGTLGHNTNGGYADWYGQPSPSAYNWYPDYTTGTVTGQNQASWTITGNSQYVITGGEFPTVNNVGQQGLVRFAVRPIAPSLDGGRVTGAKFVPTVMSLSTGTARLTWLANYERDSETLTYKVVRDSVTSKPVFTTTVTSNPWNRPGIGFTDSGLVPGSTHTYRIYMTDPYGVSTTGDTISYTVPASVTQSGYTRQLQADGAAPDLPLNEASGSVAIDNAGYNDFDFGTGVTRGATGPVAGDTATTFNGTSTGTLVNRSLAPAPTTYSTEAWFRTTSTRGGELVSYGDSQTGQSSNYDRSLYLDSGGHVQAGVYPGSVQTIGSTTAYNDGQWHQAVSTLGANGFNLYVDGQLTATNASVTSAQAYSGYWKVGGDNLNGWTNQPASSYFAGDLAQVAIFPTVVSAQTVQNEYNLATNPNANQPPIASFTKNVSGATVSVSGSASTDPDGTIASYSWNFGDATPAVNTATTTHTYAVSGLYTMTLTVTDNGGATNVSTQQVSVVVPNKPPVASFTSTVTAPTVSVDGSGSSDPDGTVAKYNWTFGDGSAAVSGSGATASHTYAAGGTYTVTLTVTDNGGATTSSSQAVTVNQPPVASFTATSTGLKESVSAAGSTDPDGTVASYSWNFGDGSAAVTGTSATASHTYAAGGTYSVTLTVTDNTGATTSTSQSVTVADQPPVASFTYTVTAPNVSVNGAGSSDPDGTIASYSFDFGDGTPAVTGTSATASHTYTAGGTYSVTLTVTDNSGVSTSSTQLVSVNQPPVGSLTTTVSGLTAAANGAGSSDPDGTIASYSFNFGDGTPAVTGNSATASHTYTAGGTYSVTLTVTDNDGVASTTSGSVTVTAPGTQSTYASDSFTRSVANGLGSATVGGAWTVAGSSSLFSVDGSQASLKMSTPGAGPSAYLNGLSVGDADLTVNSQLNTVPNGGGAYVALAAHHTSSGDYRVKLKVPASGAATLYLSKIVGGTETVLVSKTITGLTLSQADVVGIEFRLSGSGTGTTTLQANVWKTSSTEPAGWQVSTADTTAALQGAGGVGIWTYLSASSTNAPVVALFDNLLVKSLS